MVTISAENTGASSRVRVRATVGPTRLSRVEQLEGARGLVGEHHAGEQPGEHHDEDAAHAHEVQLEEEVVPAVGPAHAPAHHVHAERDQAAQLLDRVDEAPPHPLHGLGEQGGLLGLLGVLCVLGGHGWALLYVARSPEQANALPPEPPSAPRHPRHPGTCPLVMARGDKGVSPARACRYVPPPFSSPSKRSEKHTPMATQSQGRRRGRRVLYPVPAHAGPHHPGDGGHEDRSSPLQHLQRRPRLPLGTGHHRQAQSSRARQRRRHQGAPGQPRHRRGEDHHLLRGAARRQGHRQRPPLQPQGHLQAGAGHPASHLRAGAGDGGARATRWTSPSSPRRRRWCTDAAAPRPRSPLSARLARKLPAQRTSRWPRRRKSPPPRRATPPRVDRDTREAGR